MATASACTRAFSARSTRDFSRRRPASAFLLASASLRVSSALASVSVAKLSTRRFSKLKFTSRVSMRESLARRVSSRDAFSSRVRPYTSRAFVNSIWSNLSCCRTLKESSWADFESRFARRSFASRSRICVSNRFASSCALAMAWAAAGVMRMLARACLLALSRARATARSRSLASISALARSSMFSLILLSCSTLLRRFSLSGAPERPSDSDTGSAV